MPAFTDNFNFTVLLPGDSLASNGYAFVDDNIRRIDALLALGRDHEHTGASGSVSDPDTGPTLTLDTTTGNLPAGTTVRYRYSYVDQFGNETVASPETTVLTPNPVLPPNAPALSYASTGGTLLGGLYYYALTAYVNTSTEETRRGTPLNISVPFTTATNEITVGLPSLPTGADGFNVYRRAPGESTYNHLATVDMDVATPPTEWVDDGTGSPNCDRQPPSSNNTNSQNSVEVCLPGATPTVPADVTWKIYRTFTAGAWTGSLLHHVVEETFDGSGIITPCYDDVGQGTTTQSAPEVSTIAAQPSKIDLTDMNNVQGQLPPGANLVPHEVTFSYGGPLAVTTGTSVWRCPFDKAQIQNISASLGVGFEPASTDVIVDVNLTDDGATPTTSTIYTTQANRPTIPVGWQYGAATVPDVVDLTVDDLLSIDIDQIGGGATPTDEDLIVTIYMLVQSGSTTTTVTI